MATEPAQFDIRASRYEELRLVDDNWWETFDALVRLGELRGACVLEVGCGTGRLSAVLAEREHARVWAIDVSEAMVERAKANGVHAAKAGQRAAPVQGGLKFDAVVVGARVTLVGPPPLVPPELGEVSFDIATIKDADVVYVLRMQRERMEVGANYAPLREYTARWGVTGTAGGRARR